jgi:HK97 family phage prohead protease
MNRIDGLAEALGVSSARLVAAAERDGCDYSRNTDLDTLTRSYPFTQTTESDGLTLEGYAAVFDTPTRIANAWEGDFTETITRGAFSRAVRQNPKPVVQFDHGQHPLLGSIPIAALSSMREDDKGLYISARVHDNWLTEPVRDAIKSGAISGMSFRFKPAEGGEQWDGDQRTLTDVDLFELGPVVFPAYSGTEVSVRTQQLAEALADPEVRHDLALAFLLETPADTDPDEARAEEPPADPGAEVRTDEEPPADHDPSLSAPNTALHAVTSMQVRAEQALLRSMKQYEPSGLPD